MIAHYRQNRVDPRDQDADLLRPAHVAARDRDRAQLPRPLPAGVRHRHQPHQRPRLRAAADRHQDDPLQRPAGGQAVGHAVQEHVRGRGATSRTCARCSRSSSPPHEGQPAFASRWLRLLAAGALAMAFPALAAAAEFDGGSLSPLWGVPFAGMLLSIALLPLLAPHVLAPPFRQGRGGLGAGLPAAVRADRTAPPLAGGALVHALLAEYIPFIILLTALFAVAGGIHIRGNLHGSPALNTGDPRDRRGAGEPDGHHRRVDAADPAADPRQRQPQAQGARGRVLHLHRLERRRLADAAGRSAAVPRLPEGRRLLLDREEHLSRDPVPVSARCWRCSMRSTAGIPPRRRHAASTRRPTAGASASTARSTSCCWAA